MNLFEYQLATLERATDNVAPVVVGSTGFLFGAEVCLTTAQFDLNQANTLAEFAAVEADFTGYAPAAITWGVPSVADDGTVEVVATAIVFRPTDAVTPNVIYMLYITNAAGDALYYAGVFDNPPLPMNSALDQITVIVRFRPATNSIVVVVS